MRSDAALRGMDQPRPTRPRAAIHDFERSRERVDMEYDEGERAGSSFVASTALPSTDGTGRHLSLLSNS